MLIWYFALCCINSLIFLLAHFFYWVFSIFIKHLFIIHLQYQSFVDFVCYKYCCPLYHLLTLTFKASGTFHLCGKLISLINSVNDLPLYMHFFPWKHVIPFPFGYGYLLLSTVNKMLEDLMHKKVWKGTCTFLLPLHHLPRKIIRTYLGYFSLEPPHSVQFSSVTQLCLTLCKPMNHITIM